MTTSYQNKNMNIFNILEYSSKTHRYRDWMNGGRGHRGKKVVQMKEKFKLSEERIWHHQILAKFLIYENVSAYCSHIMSNFRKEKFTQFTAQPRYFRVALRGRVKL